MVDISTYELASQNIAWGNYQEPTRLGGFPSEHELIDQVKLGSPLGMALCQAVREGNTIRLDVMCEPPREVPELLTVIRWKMGLERKALDEATSLVDAEAKARRL